MKGTIKLDSISINKNLVTEFVTVKVSSQSNFDVKCVPQSWL